MEARVELLEARLKAIESRLPSWEARVKTLERNNPLEARLRFLEAAWRSNAVPADQDRHSPYVSISQVVARNWMAYPFQWIQFALRWTGQACLKMMPSTVQRQRIDSVPYVSPASQESESQKLSQLQQHHTPQESAAQINGGTAEVTESEADCSAKHTFYLKDGLEGYSQSLVLADEVSPAMSNRAKISFLHKEACARELDTYIDPESAYEVFTAHHLKTRNCCGSSCRHCPWGHRNVPSKKGVQAQDARTVCQDDEDAEPIHFKKGCDLPPPNQSPKSRLYTRKGDAGYTNLYNEEWILKSSPVYEAIGDVDELNSTVGLAAALLSSGSEMRGQLEAVQAWLLDIGSALCTPRPSTSNGRKLRRTKGISQGDVATVESLIDVADARLAQLTNFILPGGSAAAAALHVARTVCRRAERHTWPLLLAGHGEEMIGIFLNRLSDYFFVAARLESHQAGMLEKQYRIERQVDRWQRQVVCT
ncbi:unnamed protein product [Polarella glacialis]|uniref:Corrinoid adenosyltransferase MMAB n=1 Tax=Polarella glacialis TaxID=89957 RepID=A0A813H9D3_POLGL|nr:unnamed protein product [Polarella glacialis]